MTDYVQCQNDIWYALLSRAELATVNAVQYRKLVIQSTIDMKLVYLTARNSRSGAGIVVEMPTILCTAPNVQGVPSDVEFSMVVMENPTINQNPGSGTCLSAEQISIYVCETLHLLSLGQGSLMAMPQVITPANEYPGVVAYRCHFKFKSLNELTQRTGQIQITMNGDQMTLACAADPTAQIFYTTDGTWPTNAQGANPSSNLYQGAVTINSGSTIRACAYATGKLGSSIATTVAP